MDMQKIVIAVVVVGGAWYIYKQFQPTGSVGLDRGSTARVAQDYPDSSSSAGYGDETGGAGEQTSW